jgi:hypothetical protein
MADQFLVPGYYKLISANIILFGTTQRLDISALIHKIIIEESVENDSIRGYISIGDGVGLLETTPLRGEERLIIEIEDVLKTKKTFDLFVYQIDNVHTKEANDMLFYDMTFCSYMRWNAGTRKIIDSFDRSVRETAEEIFKRYYSPFTKEFKTEVTDGTFQCVIPNYTPIQALKFLATRAYNSISPSSSFRFFENSEAFYFVPDEWLIAEAISTDNIKDFTYVQYPVPMEMNVNNPSYDLEAQLRNIISLSNTDKINTIDDLHTGAYRNNPIVIDFVNKTVTNNRYSYQENKTKFASLNSGNKNIKDTHSNGFIDYTFKEENERQFLVFKDYQSLGDLPSSIRSEQYLPQIISNRLTYRYMLYRNTVYITVYGRLDLKAGDILNLIIPEISAYTDKENSKLSQLSGLYLVHDCTHTFDLDTYQVSMMLTKFDWRED